MGVNKKLPKPQTTMIDFTTRQLADSAIAIEVSGELDDLNRKYFFDCVADILDAGTKHVVIDCSRLGYINSSGLAGLLTARKRAASNGGKIYLTHLNSVISEVIETTKLGRILSVFPTTEDALTSFRGQPMCLG